MKRPAAHKKTCNVAEFRLRKLNADEMWKREFERALSGQIDRLALAIAMKRCNETEQVLIEYEARNKDRNPSKLPLS